MHPPPHAHSETPTHTITGPLTVTHACTNKALVGESIVDNTHLCSNQQWSCLFHSDTTLHKGIDEMYFIIQIFMLWYQYYGNRETNITQCSQKLSDCKSTRIVTYSNISKVFLLLIHFDFLSSGSEDLLLPVKIKGHFWFHSIHCVNVWYICLYRFLWFNDFFYMQLDIFYYSLTQHFQNLIVHLYGAFYSFLYLISFQLWK